MKKFIASDSTSDGRITKGHVYDGGFVWRPQGHGQATEGLRIVVYDNKHEWMTFRPSIFKPLIGG